MIRGVFLFCIGMSWLTARIYAQGGVLLFSQSFEGSPQDNWNYTIVPDTQGSITTGFACDGSYGLALWGTSSGNSPVQLWMDPVPLIPGSRYILKVHYGARGPDSQEDLYFVYSLDGGLTWDSIKLVDGWSNIRIVCGEVDPTSVAGGGLNQNPLIWLIPDSTASSLWVRFRYDPRSGFSSRQDTYYLDGIQLFLDTVPAQIWGVFALTPETLRLYLSETPDTLSLHGNHFRLIARNGGPVPAVNTIWLESDSTLLLTLQDTLARTRVYGLLPDTLYDLAGNRTLPRDTFWFRLPVQGSVIFTELMPDPSPSVGLPDCSRCEYVEIYNRDSFPFDLDGWTLANRSFYRVFFPPRILEPGEYLLLIHEDGAVQYASFSSIDIQAFPTFPFVHNEWGLMGLWTRDGFPVDFVEYDLSFYRDPLKTTGGWALERISTDPLCGGKELWRESRDPRGGTPGAPNSWDVPASSIRSGELYLIRRVWLSDTLTMLEFSEPLSPDWLSPARWQVSGGSALLRAIQYSPLRFRRLYLKWKVPLDSQEIYHVRVQGPTCDGRMYTFSFSVGKPSPPDSFDITFNEILMDPYPDGEAYVELYNRSPRILNPADFLLANTVCGTDSLDYVARIDTVGDMWFPGEFRVYTRDSTGVLRFYHVENRGWLVQIRPLPYMTVQAECNYVRGLMLLRRSDLQQLDRIRYASRYHHPLIYENNYGEGVALEKIHPDVSSLDSAMWRSASSSAGFGTPTAPNSQYVPLDSLQEIRGKAPFHVEIHPRRFSPDGDGWEDVMLIRIRFNEDGWLLTAYVFSLHGYPVWTLTESLLSGREEILTWDGRTYQGTIAPEGHYIVGIEAIHPLQGKGYRQRILVAITYPR